MSTDKHNYNKGDSELPGSFSQKADVPTVKTAICPTDMDAKQENYLEEKWSLMKES